MFNLKKIQDDSKRVNSNSYQRRLNQLQNRGIEVNNIEKTVTEASDNLKNGKNSFVIYGEPQSGKTEMMIALTAKLLDDGYKYIVVLMNDSIALLDQNLDRFRKAGLNTIPVSYKELLDKSVDIESQTRIIFSKKNASDLRKLIELVRKINNVVVIDDEADYATPNSKINKDEISRINELTGNLIEEGIYIGVTATPARLDLNHTHLNDPEYWIDYPKHSNYTGQDVFFPNNISEASKFKLTLLPDENDDPKYLKRALMNFLINSSYLNLTLEPEKYSMLIHTSGKKNDHTEDFERASKVMKALGNPNDRNYEKYFKEIWEIAKVKYPDVAEDLCAFIMAKIESHYMTIMNSDHDVDSSVTSNPPSPFTIIIGGNSISRGVTFDNLLSMFFTRDAKHKLQQDTYIQRARMFGARGKILNFFELSIPRTLYADWRRAFIFHRLSLESRKSGNGIPIWHEGMRIKVAASSSVDTSRVTFDKGEMSFRKFRTTEAILNIFKNENMPDLDKLAILSENMNIDSLPRYLIDFIYSFSGKDENALVIHKPRSIMGMDPKNADHVDISRKRGLIAGQDLYNSAKPDASHHIFVFTNDIGEARIVYKFNENVSFIKGKR